MRTAEGKLRVVYVTEGTGIGGGHRDIFEHLNRLLDRGHEVALYTLGDAPDWFPLRAPVHSFEFYDELVEALAEHRRDQGRHLVEHRGAGVAGERPAGASPCTSCRTSRPPTTPTTSPSRHAVLDSYRPEFRYMTISSWNRERLRELGLDAELIPPGIDLETFRPLRGRRAPRRTWCSRSGAPTR